MISFFSIGVYGTTEQSFFEKLTSNRIDTFCDIRNRRGVRGSKYSYANSKKLQLKLEELGIKYLYIPELAPTPEIRNLQKEADKNENVQKSSRHELSAAFKKAFEIEVLNKFDFDRFFKNLSDSEMKNIVLFCVEAEPRACHRSIVIEKLYNDFNFPINHIK